MNSLSKDISDIITSLSMYLYTNITNYFIELSCFSPLNAILGTPLIKEQNASNKASLNLMWV